MLEAGVAIHEFEGGLLHAKTLTVDGEIALVGSANVDRRNFELILENNILFQDAEATGQLRQRQASFIDQSSPVSLKEVRAWSLLRRLWNNGIAMIGPIL